MAITAQDQERLERRLGEIRPHLDERAWRLLLGAEARAIGRGGVKLVAGAVGASAETVSRGAGELGRGVEPDGRVRRRGAGRPAVEDVDPGLVPALEALVDPGSRGDPPARPPRRGEEPSSEAISRANCSESRCRGTEVSRRRGTLGTASSIRSSRKPSARRKRKNDRSEVALDEPSRLEFEDGFSDESGTPDASMPTIQMRVDLEEAGPGTRMTITSRFSTADQMEQLVQMGMVEGMTAAIGQIDELLAAG